MSNGSHVGQTSRSHRISQRGSGVLLLSKCFRLWTDDVDKLPGEVEGGGGGGGVQATITLVVYYFEVVDRGGEAKQNRW